MVIERDPLFRLDPYEQVVAEKFMQHNLRKVGEENKPVTIGQLDLMRGFKVEDLKGDEWTVRIIGKRGDVLVRKPNPDRKPGERHFEYRMFNPGKLVRVPKEKI